MEVLFNLPLSGLANNKPQRDVEAEQLTSQIFVLFRDFFSFLFSKKLFGDFKTRA